MHAFRLLIAAFAIAPLIFIGAGCEDASNGDGAATTPGGSDAVAGVAVGPVSEIAAKAAPAVARVGINCSSGPAGAEDCDGAGSGWMFDSGGHFITNSHVVTLGGEIDEPDSITLTLGDGRQFEASLLGHDPQTDIAVLDADIDNLEPLALGDANAARIGDPVVAIGYALDLGVSPSVTTGVISAKERQITESTSTIYGLIQTDAAINPGNSGGPLLDYSGRVLGVNTATASGSEGIGFAVSERTAEAVAHEIIENGSVERGYMGISFIEVTPGLSEQEDLGVDHGALIQEVQPGSPADQAGIRTGDVVTRIGSMDIMVASDLPLALIGTSPADELEIRLYREGDEETVVITLGEPPAA